MPRNFLLNETTNSWKWPQYKDDLYQDFLSLLVFSSILSMSKTQRNSHNWQRTACSNVKQQINVNTSHLSASNK